MWVTTMCFAAVLAKDKLGSNPLSVPFIANVQLSSELYKLSAAADRLCGE
ncbi:MAG: hypothetical protein WAU01_12100 [Saprospiraceae bacterium]